ncbi:MAG TPA: prepilin-type N-terminal cleavage/methylation domain-containing protein [Geobacteraceae bacterium]|nr:prepilin-type N-terminal cleavage/methylation domain-containing protein [Geobacteraceae bacterium]
MSMPATVLNSMTFMRTEVRKAGFTLTELLTVVSIIGIISAIALPAFSSYYDKCCLMAAISEITGMIDEAKRNALCNNTDYGVGFNPALGTVTLIAGKGPDNKWNTDDDLVIRSFSLAAKGGRLRFGYGSYGPRKNCAAAPSGVSFENNNTLICDPALSGTAGNVYLITRSGYAINISANSTDFGYKLWRWNGKQWQQM